MVNSKAAAWVTLGDMLDTLGRADDALARLRSAHARMRGDEPRDDDSEAACASEDVRRDACQTFSNLDLSGIDLRRG